MSTPNIPEGMIRYVFAWHSLSDACPKCQMLNGKEWSDQDIFQSTLWDMFWGDIWHLDAGHTLAHPNCRCQLEVRVEIDWEAWRKLQEFSRTSDGILTDLLGLRKE